METRIFKKERYFDLLFLINRIYNNFISIHLIYPEVLSRFYRLWIK